MILLTKDNQVITGHRPAICGTRLAAIVLFPEDINKSGNLIQFIENNLLTRFPLEQDSSELQCFLKDALQKYQSKQL